MGGLTMLVIMFKHVVSYLITVSVTVSSCVRYLNIVISQLTSWANSTTWCTVSGFVVLCRFRCSWCCCCCCCWCCCSDGFLWCMLLLLLLLLLLVACCVLSAACCLLRAAWCLLCAEKHYHTSRRFCELGLVYCESSASDFWRIALLFAVVSWIG